MKVEDKQAIAELLLELFQGRQDAIAVQDPGQSRMRSVPLPEPLRAEWVAETHLSGVQAIGIYPVMDDGNCYWCGADIDDHDAHRNVGWFDQSSSLCAAAAKCGVQALMSLSQSGRGAHCLIFFNEPLPARVARQFMAALGLQAGLQLREIYPKQDSVEGGKLGNCLRLPLWHQSRLLCWRHGVEIDPLEGLRAAKANRIGSSQVHAVLRELADEDIQSPSPLPVAPKAIDSTTPGVSRRVARLLGQSGSIALKRWNADGDGTDGSLSAIMQSLANELVRNYIPTPEIHAALLGWAQLHGYSDKAARIMPATLDKAYTWVAGAGQSPVKESVDFVGAVATYLEEVRAGRYQNIPFGIEELDASVDGIGPGQMCIVAGRPGHGKSLLGLQWADTAARLGHRCLFISEEMGVAEIGQRVANWDAADDDSVLALAKQRYAGGHKPQLVAHVGDLAGIERIAEYHAKHGVDCMVIDYLQLLATAAKGQYEMVSSISRRLKQLAVRLNLRLMVLCQSNRQIEARENKMPVNSDLRDSGQIEQDADLIVFCVWPLKFGIAPEGQDTHYYFCCTKRRNGPIRSEVVESRIWPERSWLGLKGPNNGN